MIRRKEANLEVAELKVLRFALIVTSFDRIRNQYIRGKSHVRKEMRNMLEDKYDWDVAAWKEKTMKRRYIDVVRGDLLEIRVIEEDTRNRRK